MFNFLRLFSCLCGTQEPEEEAVVVVELPQNPIEVTQIQTTTETTTVSVEPEQQSRAAHFLFTTIFSESSQPSSVSIFKNESVENGSLTKAGPWILPPVTVSDGDDIHEEMPSSNPAFRS